MVQTRRQWRRWADNNFQSSQGSSQGSTRSYSFDNSYQPQTRTQEDNIPTRSLYSPNDHCKRHRKPDSDPKTQTVTTYRRRTPT